MGLSNWLSYVTRFGLGKSKCSLSRRAVAAKAL